MAFPAADQELVRDCPELAHWPRCDLAVVLGSGFAPLLEQLPVEACCDYSHLTPVSAVAGHRLEVVRTRLAGRQVALFAGRLHLYQGLTAWQAGLPVRLSAALGCRRILLTNACGALSSAIAPGDFALIRDHINLQGDNPLRGLTGDIFVDLSQLYCQELHAIWQPLFAAAGLQLHQAVLAAVAGPSYETAAEVRFLRAAGADLVSMSLAGEAILARYLGMEVAGLSLTTNPATGLTPQPLAHAEVLDWAGRRASALARLLPQLLACWPEPSA